MSVIVILSIAMTDFVPFVKKICKSNSGYILWLPKDVVEFLSIKDKSFVELKLKKKGGKTEIPFIKKVSKSGRGFLLWLPKDVVEYLLLCDDDFVDVNMRNL